MNFMHHIESISPTKATVVSGLPILGQVLVWVEAIRGPAAAVTAIFGAITGFLVIVYWAIKIYNEWGNTKRAKANRPLTKRKRRKPSKE